MGEAEKPGMSTSTGGRMSMWPCLLLQYAARHRWLAGALFSLIAAPAFAQWDAGIALASRQMVFAEWEQGWRKILQEQGWLTGLVLQADHHAEDWHTRLRAEIFDGTLNYSGHLQDGAKAQSTSDNRILRTGAEVGRHLGPLTEMIAGFEWERQTRDIIGTANALGLAEQYGHYRFIAGGRRSFNLGQTRFDATVFGLWDAAERLRIEFQNSIYDSTVIRTKPGRGFRMRLSAHPRALPRASFDVEMESVRFGRSDDASLRRAGQVVGTVAEPEHSMRNLTLLLRFVL